ncbi:MAG: DoxX family protein [Proteobacteria bacterium]|nr:DoxX family protein [Pseudomonadota bacterium]
MKLNSGEDSAALKWTGRTFSGLVIVFLTMDAGIKLIPILPVIESMNDLGFVCTPGLARALGVLLLFCTALYAVPRTSVLGAVLLTGYLGGAIAIQVRAGSPLFTHILFGGYIGALLWAGLLIRNRRLRKLIFP